MSHHAFRTIAALAAVYLIWGSTFLAIRYAVETIPPLLMAGVRCLIAGGALYLWARLRGAARPEREHWAGAAQVGAFLFLFGQGAVAWGAQRVASGLTALLLATIPFWMVMLERRRRPAQSLALRVRAGLLLGLAGVGLLVGPGRLLRPGIDPLGAAALLLASVSWAHGSIQARAVRRTPSTVLTAGMQLLAGGALLLAAGLALGQGRDLNFAAWAPRSLVSLGYLIVFGSIVGFTAYVWLLKHTGAALVATYAYVNPVIALLIGWAAAGEPLTPRTLLAGGAIIAAVVLITSGPQEQTRLAAEEVAESGGEAVCPGAPVKEPAQLS